MRACSFYTMLSVNPYSNKPWFLRICSTCLLKTMWEKEKLLVTSNFFFSHIVFYPYGELYAVFIKYEIVVCKLFEFEKVKKNVVWKRVNRFGLKCHARFLFTPPTFTFNIQMNYEVVADWLVVWGSNATDTAMVLSWRSVTHLCFMAFPHQY